MRLVILTLYFPPEIGAAPTRLDAMAAELKRLGHEVEIVTAMPNYPRGKIFPVYKGRFYCREMHEGILVHRVWVFAALGGGLLRVLNYGSFVLTSIFGMLQARKPDYVFIESPPLPLTLTGYLFAKIWDVPSIMNVADMWPDAALEMGFLKSGRIARAVAALERWSYRHATYVNAMTRGIARSLLSQKNLPPAKVLFLPNGVDTLHYSPRPVDMALKQQLGLEEKKVVLYQGTHGHAHGLDTLLRAAKLLSHHPELHFLLIGDGSEKHHLEALRKDLNLSNVTFHDPVPVKQLPAFFSLAECGLVSLRNLPHLNRARPAKMFPILASGKPIIFVGQGEGAELAEQAKAGIIVPPENPEALAAAVLRLVRDPDSLREFGANGRRFVEAHLQWSTLVSAWVAQLRDPAGQEFAARSN
jgi:colanic acid biosynthesis glycosyl transferase WcaI